LPEVRETRAKRAGEFSRIDEMLHFVESTAFSRFLNREAHTVQNIVGDQSAPANSSSMSCISLGGWATVYFCVMPENVNGSGKTVAHEFHLEQLKALRGEISDRINYLRHIELYAVLGNVGVWAFLLGHKIETTSMRVAWFAPVLLNLLCILKRSSIETEMHAVAEYVRQAERYFVLPCLEGWEVWAEQHKFRKRFKGFNVAFWAVLLITSLGLAVWKGILST
jgi:hypothetical protein